MKKVYKNKNAENSFSLMGFFSVKNIKSQGKKFDEIKIPAKRERSF